MNKTIVLILCGLFCQITTSQVIYETIESSKLGQTREIKIQLPRNYDPEGDVLYPLVVVFDGDYLFEPIIGNADYHSYWGDMPKSIIVKYLEDFKCTIYEKRSSICRNYPLSAHIDNNIYIDEICPAVNDIDNPSHPIVHDNKVKKEFDNDFLHDYQDKYIDMFEELKIFSNKEEFEEAIIINGIIFYKYRKETNNKFMQMHQKSLVHLQDSYFTSLN